MENQNNYQNLHSEQEKEVKNKANFVSKSQNDNVPNHYEDLIPEKKNLDLFKNMIITDYFENQHNIHEANNIESNVILDKQPQVIINANQRESTNLFVNDLECNKKSGEDMFQIIEIENDFLDKLEPSSVNKIEHDELRIFYESEKLKDVNGTKIQENPSEQIKDFKENIEEYKSEDDKRNRFGSFHEKIQENKLPEEFDMIVNNKIEDEDDDVIMNSNSYFLT